MLCSSRISLRKRGAGWKAEFVRASREAVCASVMMLFARSILPVNPSMVNAASMRSKLRSFAEIFQEFAHGSSPRAIACALNKEVVPGPAGKSWAPSTVYGNWRRGTGILNNERYIGRLVWNRQQFIKDPDTGKRQARLNPESKWILEEVPSFASSTTISGT